MEIPKKDIEPSSWNPRGDGEGLKELTDSIKGLGLIEPVVVRPNIKKKGKYLISAGEQRWKGFSSNEKVPCVIREKDDETDAKIVSLVENYIRKNVTDDKNEEFIAKLYEEGIAKKKWVSVNDMSKITGIPHQIISECATANKERKEMKLLGQATERISTADMTESRSLKDKPELRKQFLEKRAEAKEYGKRDKDQPTLKRSGHVVFEKAKILSKVPEPIAKAVLDDKIDWDQVETVATTIEQTGKPVSKKEELQLQKHLEAEKRMLDVERTLSKKTTELEVKGKPEKHIKFDKTNDERTLEYFKKLCDTFKFMTKADINIIDDEKIRAKAITCIKKIRDDCSRLLKDLGEETVIDVT